MVCLWLVFQVGGHFLPAGAKPRDAGAASGALAATINVYSLALLVALAGNLCAWRRIRRHPWGVGMSPQELARVATALAIVIAAELAAGVTTALLLFQLPGAPPPVEPLAMASSELLAVIVGTVFALNAIARFAALATIRGDH